MPHQIIKSLEFFQHFYSCFRRIRLQTVDTFQVGLYEALRIWSQHYGIEYFWRQLKSSLYLSAMSLESTLKGM